jgi:GNAT superfamily N-acetyltransferase
MSGAISIALLDAPDQEARKVIICGLDDYNAERAPWDSTALDVVARDGSGQTVGGLVGRTSLGVLFIDYFYLPDSLRGGGIGSRILAAAEAEAVARGCARAVLFTMTIQAPSFYEKRGYRIFGRIDCDPPGNARIFMTRELRPIGDSLTGAITDR